MIKKGRKRKSNVLHKTKLTPVTLFSILNFESEHINVVKITKNYHSIINFLCQYLEKKIATSCPELLPILKILPHQPSWCLRFTFDLA